MKLKLDLDDLTVDSFDTAPAGKPKGTVFGEQCTCYTNCTCPGGPTCDASCDGTCAASCNTTCNAKCSPTSYWVCYSANCTVEEPGCSG